MVSVVFFFGFEIIIVCFVVAASCDLVYDGLCMTFLKC